MSIPIHHRIKMANSLKVLHDAKVGISFDPFSVVHECLSDIEESESDPDVYEKGLETWAGYSCSCSSVVGGAGGGIVVSFCKVEPITKGSS